MSLWFSLKEESFKHMVNKFIPNYYTPVQDLKSVTKNALILKSSQVELLNSV